MLVRVQANVKEATTGNLRPDVTAIPHKQFSGGSADQEIRYRRYR
jgi:hypothetical protein